MELRTGTPMQRRCRGQELTDSSNSRPARWGSARSPCQREHPFHKLPSVVIYRTGARVNRMSELDTVRTFYRYNSTVRRAYLKKILRLAPAERLKDRGASYPSVQEIYAHVLDSLRYWFDLVPRDRAADALKLELPARDLTDEQLLHWTDEADRIVNEFLAPLQDPDLGREIIYHAWTPTGAPGAEERIRIGDLLWHMVREEFQHRGELNALLWQMDVEPPLGTFKIWEKSKVGRMYVP
jgi:uncharacterized damage-inducible protein DinB